MSIIFSNTTYSTFADTTVVSGLLVRGSEDNPYNIIILMIGSVGAIIFVALVILILVVVLLAILGISLR